MNIDVHFVCMECGIKIPRKRLPCSCRCYGASQKCKKCNVAVALRSVEDIRLTADINQKGLVDALKVALSAIDDAINAGLDLDSRTWDSLEDAGVRVRNELNQFLPYRPVGDPPY